MAVTLATVETAIAEVQSTGQNFTVDGISYSRANLSALIQLRDKMVNESSRSTGARPVFRGFNFSGAGYSDMGNS